MSRREFWQIRSLFFPQLQPAGLVLTSYVRIVAQSRQSLQKGRGMQMRDGNPHLDVMHVLSLDCETRKDSPTDFLCIVHLTMTVKCQLM